jgi:4-hydroxybenzoate polyprenyltransferase
MILKNGLVLAALIFAQKVGDPDSALGALAAYGIFAALSGVVYLFNDVMDAEQDRQHPEKKDRPVVSGKLHPAAALAACIVIGTAAVAAAFFVSNEFGAVASLYLALNLAYTLYLKHVVIIDVLVVSFGFLLRVIGGAVAITVPISNWLVICTFLLALFLAFSKRRHEIISLGDDAAEHRKILTEYSAYFLDQVIAVVTSSTLVAYMLYTISAGAPARHLPLTIPFVLYGIFRYLYLVHRKEKGGNPTKVLVSDLPLLINIALWVGAVYLILYQKDFVSNVLGVFGK